MGKDKVDTLRHSTAHLMAQAIQLLFPKENVQFGIGPTIENGFYYDIEMNHRLTDEDLVEIQKKMQELIKKNIPITREVLDRDSALNLFKQKKQKLKLELINELSNDEEISCYTQDDFTDLCRGPHLESTRQISPFFKLMSVAGAYWRGDEKRNLMLQRVYASCFSSKQKLKEHLKFLEEAKKRDHRKLGKELELFHFDPISPGSPFFMPKGAFVYNNLVDYIRRLYKHYHYKEVITPQVLDVDLWHTSGHYENYKDNMYFTNIDNREYGLKPMNCPCHMLMYKHYKYSYRDLPLRYADFGRLHRYEKSGTLAGLTRVRTFCQDDAHIFLGIKQIQDEIKDLMNMFMIGLTHFGFKNIKIFLSTRPAKKVGDDATWDIAEEALKNALDSYGKEYEIKEGDGAFYGPKIDLDVADSLNRYHQLGTIQLDFQLPERFNLKFTNEQGEIERPVVIHRALLGSIERFIGVYLEHIAGAFPFWLAPTQAVIIPVNNDSHLEYSKELKNTLEKIGYRVDVDDRNESMGKKIRETQKSKIPFSMVIGDREKENTSVSLRKYSEKQSDSISNDELFVMFKDLDKEKVPKELRDK